ncbi:TPA: DUF3950 domain-containing protein [Klebsiella pneumoniae]|nr:DUF3950 domain-containing protein [Klebsiella pneumoniae]
MATKAINAKSAQKKIRFPHELIEDIESNVEQEKSRTPGANFSAWVLDACREKLRQQGIEPKG